MEVQTWLAAENRSHRENLCMHATPAAMTTQNVSDVALQNLPSRSFRREKHSAKSIDASSPRVDANNVPRINTRRKRCHTARHRANHGVENAGTRVRDLQGSSRCTWRAPDFAFPVARDPGKGARLACTARAYGVALLTFSTSIQEASRLIAETGGRLRD